MWSGERWIAEPTLRVLDLLRLICLETAGSMDGSARTRVSSMRTVGGAEHLARMHRKHAAVTEQWDSDLWLVNTMGGVVDLRTGDIRSSRRADYMTKMMAATPRGNCPRWKEFLVEICGGDMNLVAYLQRAVGYSLTGITSEHVLFFLWGTGANGKSVFMTVITAILADYAATAPLDTFMETRTVQHPTDVAGLRGARLVACTETEQGRRWAESKIKALTGGDKVSARFMRQDFFTFTPQFKLWIAGNHKPYIRNVDEAMKRRVHLVPFTVTIPYEKRDKRLAAKLLQERDGILKWMAEGCREWQRIGLAPPKAVLDATEEYFQEEDSIGQFINEECVQQRYAKTALTDVFARWKTRAEERGEYVGTSKWLSRELASRGIFTVPGHARAVMLDGWVLRDSSAGYGTTSQVGKRF
jgi:putative DNA primase/helicase